MATTKEYPGEKTYTAANGHRMVVEPQYSPRNGGEWHYVYAYAGHADDCFCYTSEEGNYDVSEYAGEREYYD